MQMRILILLFFTIGVFSFIFYYQTSTQSVTMANKTSLDNSQDDAFLDVAGRSKLDSSDGVATTTNTQKCERGLFNAQYGLCVEEIGKTLNDRSIESIRVGFGEKQILLIGGLHTGTEENSVEIVFELLEWIQDQPDESIEHVTLFLIPAVNVDGWVEGTHNNARNVDLNRNWPTRDWKQDTYHPVYGELRGAGGTQPLSEPETKALYEYVQEIQPALIVTYHSQAGSVEDNNVGNVRAIAQEYASAANYEHIEEWTHYEVTGDFLSSMGEVRMPAFDVEMQTREVELERNKNALMRIFEYMKN